MEQIESFFCSQIYVIDDVFSEKENQEFSEKAIELSNQLNYTEKEWQGDTISSFKTLNLLDFDIYRLMAEKVNSYVHRYAKVFGCSEEYFLNNFWFNIARENTYQEYHDHPNHIISAIYYSKTPEGSGYLQFQNPYLSNITLKKPDPLKPVNYEFVRYQPIQGRLIIFRSHLKHLVSKTTTKNSERISFAFNFN